MNGETRAREFSIDVPRGHADIEAFARIMAEAFDFPTPDEYDLAVHEGLDGLRLVRRGGEVVGGLNVPVVGQYFGGRSVPMGALRAVAVAPHHRATGAGGALVRHVLHELYERGVPLSALYPATQPIYRRQGYEQAGTWTAYRLPVRAIDVRDRALEVVSLDPNDLDWSALRDLYDRVAGRANGMLDRTDWFWRRRFFTGSKRTPTYAYGIRGEHGLQGYVSFMHAKGARQYDLDVKDIVADSPAAVRRLWSLLADHRSVAGNVLWVGPPCEALLMGLAEMEAEVTRRIHWMLRLVDVPAALEARGFAHEITGELHLAVHDDVLTHNHGHFVVQVKDGHAEVTRGGRGEIEVGAGGLAALYSGYMSPFQLRQAGLLEGPDAALATAMALFAGPAPWMVDFF